MDALYKESAQLEQQGDAVAATTAYLKALDIFYKKFKKIYFSKIIKME